MDQPVATADERVGGWPTLWKLTVATTGTCMRYRVTGLAAEAAFFALLSLPPLVLGVVASLGYFANLVGPETVTRVTNSIISLSGRALTEESIKDIVVPTLSTVQQTRYDILSIGFVLALWSGSRALNVYIDTISIMYGLGGRRGIIRTRALSFTLYVVALVLAMIAVPLLLAGPEFVASLIPESLAVLNALYWPTLIVVSIVFLTTLYHLSVPVRSSWRSELPGAAIALLIWILGAIALRWTLSIAVGGTSIYGPLTTPIAVLLWLYVTAIAVLIGAALNAEIDKLYPGQLTKVARAEMPTVTPERLDNAAEIASAEQNPIARVRRGAYRLRHKAWLRRPAPGESFEEPPD